VRKDYTSLINLKWCTLFSQMWLWQSSDSSITTASSVEQISLPIFRLSYYEHEGWSKISGTEFTVGKRKHLQVTQSYLLQSTTLQIVCSDSSNPSTFQCMSGRLVWEWPATAMSYLVVSPRRLEIIFPSGCFSAWGRERSRREPNLVSKAGGEPRECYAWPRIP
jgi:hypothetical protein